MSIETVLDTLSDDAADALREVLRRAYERGFREGLAAKGPKPTLRLSASTVALLAGNAGDDSESAPDRSQAEGTGAGSSDESDLEAQPGLTGSGAKEPEGEDGSGGTWDRSEELGGGSGEVRSLTSSSRSVNWGRSEVDEEPSDSDEQEAPRERTLLISPHATVGTLRNRIMSHFGLHRFDVDIVICRSGDKDRRQLRGDVRLSKYRVE
jgi:hypothetical protein